jgi:hypothetical protein
MHLLAQLFLSCFFSLQALVKRSFLNVRREQERISVRISRMVASWLLLLFVFEQLLESTVHAVDPDQVVSTLSNEAVQAFITDAGEGSALWRAARVSFTSLSSCCSENYPVAHSLSLYVALPV